MRILAIADTESKSLWDYYQPEKLSGFMKYALSGPDQVDHRGRVHICARRNDPDRSKRNCLDSRLSEKTGGFFV